jgi:hypothetical protein
LLDATGMQYGDAIGEAHRFGLVVRHPSSPETAGGGSHPLSSTGERRTRQPAPTLCPEHLFSSVLFYGTMTNQINSLLSGQ